MPIRSNAEARDAMSFGALKEFATAESGLTEENYLFLFARVSRPLPERSKFVALPSRVLHPAYPPARVLTVVCERDRNVLSLCPVLWQLNAASGTRGAVGRQQRDDVSLRLDGSLHAANERQRAVR